MNTQTARADIRAVALKQRARMVGEALAADPRAGTALGRCLLLKSISRSQYRAGLQLEALSQLYTIGMGLPAGHARALDVTRIPGGPLGGREMKPATVARIRRRYDQARTVLMRANVDAYRTVPLVVLEDHSPTIDHLLALRTGLDVLRAHFEAGGGRGNGKRPNRVLAWWEGDKPAIPPEFWE